MSLAWLSYRQYFPALYVAQGGRPYPFTELNEQRYDAIVAPYPQERDLELGQTRQTQRQVSPEGERLGGRFSDDDRLGIKPQDSQSEQATQDLIPGSSASTTMQNGGVEIH